MAEISLGLIQITNAGPIRATANLANPLAPCWAASYRMQHWPGNSGLLYVGTADMEFSTGTATLGWLEAPGVVPSAPPYDSQFPWGPLSSLTDMSTIFVDGSVPGDSVLVTYMQT